MFIGHIGIEAEVELFSQFVDIRMLVHPEIEHFFKIRDLLPIRLDVFLRTRSDIPPLKIFFELTVKTYARNPLKFSIFRVEVLDKPFLLFNGSVVLDNLNLTERTERGIRIAILAQELDDIFLGEPLVAQPESNIVGGRIHHAFPDAFDLLSELILQAWIVYIFDSLGTRGQLRQDVA